MTKAEAKAETKKQIKELVEAYKKQIETMVNDKIAEIKTEYKKIKDAITQIPEDVTAAIGAIALPPAIGVPPVAPNPLYALIIAKQAKHSLQSLLNIVISALLTLLKAATAILFEVPDVVLGIGATITILAKVLNTIPG
jgi:Fe2+ transport system protein B